MATDVLDHADLTQEQIKSVKKVIEDAKKSLSDCEEAISKAPEECAKNFAEVAKLTTIMRINGSLSIILKTGKCMKKLILSLS